MITGILGVAGAGVAPGGAEGARGAAEVAGRRVDVLIARQEAASAAVTAAVGGLTASFAATAAAEQAEVAARATLARDRALHAHQVRALYAEGTLGFSLTVLGAGSADDALWRAGSVERVFGQLIGRSAAATAESELVARAAAARRAAAAQADHAHGRLLARARGEEEAAAAALAQARATLARLAAEARRAEAAEAAARRLAEAEAAAARARAGVSAGPVTALGIPTAFEAAYRAAARTCPGLRWTLLAGLGQVESGHGRNTGPSSAGAIGPMQFMPRTFASVGVDGDGDGLQDPWDPEDAAFSAARYLCISGADGSDAGLRRALFAYNHAQWYVELVLRTEAAIVARGATP